MALTSITNISQQVVPILINSISSADADAGATIPASTASQLQIAPGAEVEIETERIDQAQLEQLQRLKVITFTAR